MIYGQRRSHEVKEKRKRKRKSLKLCRGKQADLFWLYKCEREKRFWWLNTGTVTAFL